MPIIVVALLTMLPPDTESGPPPLWWPINQIDQTDQIDQIDQTNQTNETNQTDQTNQTNQTNHETTTSVSASSSWISSTCGSSWTSRSSAEIQRPSPLVGDGKGEGAEYGYQRLCLILKAAAKPRL
jgi:hypothetical protein